MSVSAMLLQLLQAFGITAAIFALTLLGALPLGLPVALGRMSKCAPLRWLMSVYISVMRGTPLMLQLLMWYFGPFYLWGMNIGNYKLCFRYPISLKILKIIII